jgi:hypothetical protein
MGTTTTRDTIIKVARLIIRWEARQSSKQKWSARQFIINPSIAGGDQKKYFELENFGLDRKKESSTTPLVVFGSSCG